MEDGNKSTLSLKAAYSFGVAHGLEKEIAEIRDMVIEWDLSYTSSLRRGYNKIGRGRNKAVGQLLYYMGWWTGILVMLRVAA